MYNNGLWKRSKGIACMFKFVWREVLSKFLEGLTWNLKLWVDVCDKLKFFVSSGNVVMFVILQYDITRSNFFQISGAIGWKLIFLNFIAFYMLPWCCMLSKMVKIVKVDELKGKHMKDIIIECMIFMTHPIPTHTQTNAHVHTRTHTRAHSHMSKQQNMLVRW